MYYHGAFEHDRLYDRRSAADLLRRHGYQVVEVRLANMLPLTLTKQVVNGLARPLWALNRVLSAFRASTGWPPTSSWSAGRFGADCRAIADRPVRVTYANCLLDRADDCDVLLTDEVSVAEAAPAGGPRAAHRHAL